MIGFLKPKPHLPPIDERKVDGEYSKQRWKVFAGIFIGYAAYYLVRKNFSLRPSDCLKTPQLLKTLPFINSL